MRVYLELALGFSDSQNCEELRVRPERAKLQAFQAIPPRVPWARGYWEETRVRGNAEAWGSLFEGFWTRDDC